MSRDPPYKRGGKDRHADTELLGLLKARGKLRSQLDSIERKFDALTLVPDYYKYWTVNVNVGR
jgi:hypothetical protein